MSDNSDLWEVRELPSTMSLELQGGAAPALVLVQGESRVRVELPHARRLVAALTDAAADLAEVLARGSISCLRCASARL